MKGEAGLLSGAAQARVPVIGGVGMEEREMFDRRGLGLPNWIPKASESAAARTQNYTHARRHTTRMEMPCAARG